MERCLVLLIGEGQTMNKEDLSFETIIERHFFFFASWYLVFSLFFIFMIDINIFNIESIKYIKHDVYCWSHSDFNIDLSPSIPDGEFPKVYDELMEKIQNKTSDTITIKATPVKDNNYNVRLKQ